MTTTPESALRLTHPTPNEMRIEREFDAPRQLVWDAHTRPELLRQWMLGMDGWSMPRCEFDAREGGRYRYEWVHDETGEQMAMGGTIREIAPIERMVATEEFDEAWYPGECVNTSTFEDLPAAADSGGGGRTRLTVTSRFDSEEALKTAAETGMLDGMVVTYDRLADVLSRLVSHT